jgi:hypothetical protein
LNWRQIFQTPNYRGVQNQNIPFLTLKYRARPGLQDKRKFFHEIAMVTTRCPIETGFAKNFAAVEKGFGAFPVTEVFKSF